MKHLRARMNLAKEMIDEGGAEIIHVKAPQMKADGLTKPYDEVKHWERCNPVDRWALYFAKLNQRKKGGLKVKIEVSTGVKDKKKSEKICEAK